MISANELRIGNYVLDDKNEIAKIECLKTKEYVEWDGSDKEQMFFSLKGELCYTCDEVNGVPLTSEILKQCGFENGKLGNFQIGYNGDDFIQAQMSVPFEDKLIKVKYLHQLQNLFYAIMGEELQIDLEVQVSDTTTA
jgi:hypothetical protein